MKQKFIIWLWTRLPLAEREAFVGSWLMNRARRRAALGPFPRALEDEMNNAAVDIIRDFNQATF